jgi:hypothetical protein
VYTSNYYKAVDTNNPSVTTDAWRVIDNVANYPISTPYTPTLPAIPYTTTNWDCTDPANAITAYRNTGVKLANAAELGSSPAAIVNWTTTFPNQYLRLALCPYIIAYCGTG